MTTELEKQFFDTFGIEPHYYCDDEYIFEAMLEYECTEGNREKCKTCKKVGKSYPQITDHILLELICIANQHENYPISTNIKNIQARTLRILLRTEKLYKKYHGSDGRYKKLVKQVRTLFKE